MMTNQAQRLRAALRKLEIRDRHTRSGRPHVRTQGSGTSGAGFGAARAVCYLTIDEAKALRGEPGIQWVQFIAIKYRDDGRRMAVVSST